MVIDAKNVSEFEEQFREILGSADAAIESVLYFFEVEQPIPRVVGESSIVYIGQTQRSFRQRYKSNQSIGIEKDCFENFYGRAIQNYGPLRIRIEKSSDPVRDEARAFREYREVHLEFPPLNRTIPHRVLTDENI